MFESDLLDPYERLLRIEVLGRAVEVPERNSLLRCFQFLSVNTISYGDFCWNGDCTNCQVWFRDSAQAPAAAPKPALACRTDVREGMVITNMDPHIRIKGVNE